VAGKSATLTVLAAGTAPLTDQWLKDGVNVRRATRASLALSRITTDQAGFYSVVVRNPVGAATSVLARVTVLVPPSIRVQPASQSVTNGADVSFQVVAAGTEPLSYQWQQDGAELPGANAALLRLENVEVDQAGTYRVVVSNSAGSVLSARANLAVRFVPPPTPAVEPGLLSDFNDDERPDLILQDDDGNLAAWFMDAHQLLSARFLVPQSTRDPDWRVVASGHFDHDSQPDLLLQHSDSTLAVWHMDGVQLDAAAFLEPSAPSDPGWRAAASYDFDRNGASDILLQHDDGRLAIWLMNGVRLASGEFVNPPRPNDRGWRAVGAADLDRDGRGDILFQHDDGSLAAWYMKGAELVRSLFLNPATTGDMEWRVTGAADLNRDGNADLLLQNRSTREIGVWYMEKSELLLGTLLQPSSPGGTWQVMAP
jgi:hypothetical protein